MSKCRPFSLRKLVDFDNQLLILRRRPKINYYSKHKYLRIFYKRIIERMKISLNCANWANLKFAYFERQQKSTKVQSTRRRITLK